MQINSNPSTNNAALSAFLNPRPATGATAAQNSSATPGNSEAAQLDPSTQNLSNVSVNTQDAQWEIQDAQGADQVMNSLQRSMMSQPGAAMSSQANQFQLLNALGLLQSGEE